MHEYLIDAMRQPGGLAAAGMFAHNEGQKAIGGMTLPTEAQLADVAEWLPSENDPRCWASIEEAQTRVEAGVARDIASGQAQLQTIRRYLLARKTRQAEQDERAGRELWTAQHTCDVCGEINSQVKRDPAFWAGMFPNDRYVLQEHLKRLPQAHVDCLIVFAWERARRAAAVKVGRRSVGEHAAALVDSLTA